MSKIALTCTLVATILLSSGLVTAQTWKNESPDQPLYNRLLRRYKAAKTEIDAGNVSAARNNVLLGELRTVRQRATAMRANESTARKPRLDLVARYDFFIDALNHEITALDAANSPNSLRLFKGVTAYSPNAEITTLYRVAENLRGNVWVALMRSDDPRYDLPYNNSPIDLSKYQARPLDDRAEGTFRYTAPEKPGDYEIRMFEKTRGRLLAQAPFRVQTSFLDELKGWRHEIGNAFAEMELKYGFFKIRGTYVKAFEAAGANDYNGYAGSWAPSFWGTFLSFDRRNATSVLYHNPLQLLEESIGNISNFHRPYTKADVDHYRDGMSRWRATHPLLRKQFDRYIALEAEKNRDLKETQAKLRALKGEALEFAEAAAKTRSDNRMSRRAAIVYEIEQLAKKAIFDHAAARPR